MSTETSTVAYDTRAISRINAEQDSTASVLQCDPAKGAGGTMRCSCHGVCGCPLDRGTPPRALTYRAGVMLLDGHDPRQALSRSARSLLAPGVATERAGVVPRVVFPTGLDARPDGQLDVYYGMADSRIGVDLRLPRRPVDAGAGRLALTGPSGRMEGRS